MIRKFDESGGDTNGGRTNKHATSKGDRAMRSLTASRGVPETIQWKYSDGAGTNPGNSGTNNDYPAPLLYRPILLIQVHCDLGESDVIGERH